MRKALAEAIELLQKGGAADVERALQLLQQTVLSFGIKVCGHREDGEDTAQEVLLKAMPYLVRFEDPAALSAWLYTAAKNRCWQGRRTASHKRTIALDQLLPDDAELESLLVAGRSAGPEQHALDRQEHDLLRQAVLALPAQYRIVLVLHDMEELDSDLVAKILSIRPGTVRVRLHRARLLVRQEMAKMLRRTPVRTDPGKPAAKRPVRRSRKCREIFANLSEYLDGNLEAESCERMRRHIDACPACVAFIEDLKRAIDGCRALEVCPEEEARPVLRRLLTEEYLRLKNSSQNL